MSLHNPWILKDARPIIVDPLLTLMFRTQYWCSLRHLCEVRQPIVQSQVNVASQPLHLLWFKAKNCRRSVDTHFKDGVVLLWHTVLPRKRANIAIMDQSWRTTLGLWKVQGPKLLMLCWHSFLGHSCDVAPSVFDSGGGRLFDYELMLPHSPCIFQDVNLEIVDTALTLSSRT